jgi:hypothetical protein
LVPTGYLLASLLEGGYIGHLLSTLVPAGYLLASLLEGGYIGHREVVKVTICSLESVFHIDPSRTLGFGKGSIPGYGVVQPGTF